MDISRPGQLYSMAAENMLTDMVLPNLKKARIRAGVVACVVWALHVRHGRLE